MEGRGAVLCAVSFVAGLLVMRALGAPPPPPGHGGERVVVQQMGDGFVIENEYGHSVYSSSGTLKDQRLSALGVKMQLEGLAPPPQVLKTEKGELIHFLNASFSHEKGINVVHEFYELRDGKLVRVPIVER